MTRVPEVWRYAIGGLHCVHLIRGKYQPRESSRAFPFLSIASLKPFLEMVETTDETTIIRKWRQWVIENLSGKV